MISRTLIKAHAALALATMIFGVNYWLSKGLMPDYLQPRQLVLLRIAGAGLIFWLLAFLQKNEQVKRSDLLRIAMAALFGTTVNQLLFSSGSISPRRLMWPLSMFRILFLCWCLLQCWSKKGYLLSKSPAYCWAPAELWYWSPIVAIFLLAHTHSPAICWHYSIRWLTPFIW